MAEMRVVIASQPFPYLSIWVDVLMFETQVTHTVGIADDVVCTAVNLTSGRVMNFLFEIEILISAG
jgi:hypothetical protein